MASRGCAEDVTSITGAQTVGHRPDQKKGPGGCLSGHPNGTRDIAKMNRMPPIVEARRLFHGRATLHAHQGNRAPTEPLKVKVAGKMRGKADEDSSPATAELRGTI